VLGMSNSSQQELERKINAVQEQLHPTSAASGGASVEQENASTKSSADKSVQDFDIYDIIKMVEGKPVRLSILAKVYQKTYGHSLVYEGKLKQILREKLIEGKIPGYGCAGELGNASFGRLVQLGDIGTITDEW